MEKESEIPVDFQWQRVDFPPKHLLVEINAKYMYNKIRQHNSCNSHVDVDLFWAGIHNREKSKVCISVLQWIGHVFAIFLLSWKSVILVISKYLNTVFELDVI